MLTSYLLVIRKGPVGLAEYTCRRHALASCSCKKEALDRSPADILACRLDTSAPVEHLAEKVGLVLEEPLASQARPILRKLHYLVNERALVSREALAGSFRVKLTDRVVVHDSMVEH